MATRVHGSDKTSTRTLTEEGLHQQSFFDEIEKDEERTPIPMQEHYKRVLKALENYRFKKNILNVFTDVVGIMALRLSILCDPYKADERKEELKRLCKDYDEKELRNLLNLFHEMMRDLPSEPTDALGWLYMQLIPKSANTQGKVYTPVHVAGLMCEMTFNRDEFDKKVENDGVFEIYDPCCGGGVFCISYVNLLNKQKINYTEKVIFHLEDLDITAVHMTYIQMSYLGASAIILHKNTLTMQTFDTFRTGGYILAHLTKELIVRKEMEKFKPIFDLLKMDFKGETK